MHNFFFLLLFLGLPSLTWAQGPIAFNTKVAPSPTLRLSLPAQDKDPSFYKKRGDTFLLLGLGLNIISAGTYLMVPGLTDKPKDPTAQYYNEMVRENQPSKWPEIKSRYDQAMVIYYDELNKRNQKIQRIRYGCIAAFSLGVTLDVAAILNFKKRKQ